MRARQPDESGYVVNSGVRIHYEVHGTGQPTILLLPTWAVVDSRHWKMQVPFLARDYRVITFDPRGNGRSDRPRNPAAYADAEFASDAAAVLDATGTERAVLAAFCSGFPWALLFAAAHPQQVAGIVTIAPTLPVPPSDPWEEGGHSFDDVLDTTEGWAKENRHYWHWEQQHFVTHRLNHYRAGLRMDYTTTTADELATTMRAALAQAGTRAGYRKVPRGGASRAAARIAALLAGQ